MKNRLKCVLLVLLLVALAIGTSFAQATKPQMKTSSAAASSVVLKHTPGMTVQSLAARSDQDMIEFAGGRKVSVGFLRALDKLKQAVNTPRAKNPNFARLLQRGPQAFQVKPAAGGAPVTGATGLATALKTLQDKDTVQLPSGRVATVEQMRLVQSLVEQKVGRKIDAVPGRPALTGPALKVTAQTTKDEWTKILKSPDNTILQSPSGQRVTVYELKQYLASNKNKPGSRQLPVPAKTQPRAQKGRPQ